MTASPTAQRVPTDRLLDRLSRREAKVLRLIADGLSDPAIAAQTHLSDASLKAICSSIFTKLELQPSEHFERRVVAALVLLQEGRNRR